MPVVSDSRRTNAAYHAAAGGAGAAARAAFLEQLYELVRHRAGELAQVGDRDGAPVVARHVVADADRKELDGRARFDLGDHLAQVSLQ